jgi:hypothetical protein
MQAHAPFDAIVSGYSIHHQPDSRKREIGYEEVDCYFRIYELAVFAGRKPNQQS